MRRRDGKSGSEAGAFEDVIDPAAADGASTGLGAGSDADDATAVFDADAADDAATTSTARVSGWGRVFRGNRLLWTMAAIAVLCMVGGLLAGRFILSPADQAAGADVPDPGLVTAPVAFGELSNDVTIRADVGYANAVEVTLDTTSISGVAVVTGHVPKAGDTLNPLSIAMEIGGRPVIVLPGELPAYRTLQIGVSGPDVLQLRAALHAVGIDGGDTSVPDFDQGLADAVGQLYIAAGYAAPAGEEGAEASVRAAEENVRSSEQAVGSAEAALRDASAGPSALQIREADNAVNAAQRALDRATPADDVDALRDALAIAQLQRDQLWAGKDTSAERASIDAANEALARAREDLDTARRAVQPSLPSSEVLYLQELPRRVDEVKTARGSVLQGAAMTVSGATVELTGAAAAADAKLLKPGDEATFQLPDGATHTAKIESVEPGKGSERWSVKLQPAELSTEQLQSIQGTNVRVSIPVGATEGEVLSVPLAALTAGPGGESRVEVVDSDPREGVNAKTHLVVVETGLSAGGFVEVTPKDGTLAEGDLVVIGE